MYALFAYVGGEWGFVGFDPHEGCAVGFIENVDQIFGEGSAFVAKLPDKSEHTPIGDSAAKHLDFESMQQLLQSLEQGNLDLDQALKNFNENK